MARRGASELLSPREVHVWWADLDRDAAAAARWEPLLSDGERDRAGSFRGDRLRSRFVTRHVLLRLLLARYLALPPDELELAPSANGKPILAGPRRAQSLEFSLSHSDRIALFAVADGRAVGVDVERMRSGVADGVAERFFTPIELAALRALPLSLRERGFFACWARKEACLKAAGIGLSEDPGAFEVSVAPDETAAIWRARGAASGSPWSLADVPLGDGYAAAVALRHDELSLTLMGEIETPPR